MQDLAAAAGTAPDMVEEVIGVGMNAENSMSLSSSEGKMKGNGQDDRLGDDFFLRLFARSGIGVAS